MVAVTKSRKSLTKSLSYPKKIVAKVQFARECFDKLITGVGFIRYHWYLVTCSSLRKG